MGNIQYALYDRSSMAGIFFNIPIWQFNYLEDMWQEIITFGIVLITVVAVIMRVVKKNKSKNSSSCDSCDGCDGCDLKKYSGNRPEKCDKDCH